MAGATERGEAGAWALAAASPGADGGACDGAAKVAGASGRGAVSRGGQVPDTVPDMMSGETSAVGGAVQKQTRYTRERKRK